MRRLLNWFLSLIGAGNLAQRPKASTVSEESILSYPDVWFDSEHDYIPKPPPPLPRKKHKGLRSRLAWESWNANGAGLDGERGTDAWAGVAQHGPFWHTVYISGQSAAPRFGHVPGRWGSMGRF